MRDGYVEDAANIGFEESLAVVKGEQSVGEAMERVRERLEESEEDNDDDDHRGKRR